MPADTEEVLARLPSLKQARRQLDEMTSLAGLTPAGYGEHSLDYKSKDGSSIYTIVKRAERQWFIVKRRKT